MSSASDEHLHSATEGSDVQWNPVSKSSTHELVIEAIEQQVMSGRLKVGDTLPAERDLAAMLGVSRAAVREAIRVLESLGALSSRVGSGLGSGTTVTAMPSQALTRLLRLHVGLSIFPVADVIELRIALERASAALAARSITKSAQQRLQNAITVMSNPSVTRVSFNDADTEFHVAIAEAGGNRLVADLTTAIRESLSKQILQALHEAEAWPELRGNLIEQHQRIFEAITAGDAEVATRLAEDHIRYAVAALPLGHVSQF